MEPANTSVIEPVSRKDAGPAQPQGPRRLSRQTLWRLAVWVLLIDMAIVALVAGLRLRRWAWEQTAPIRYSGDITNGFARGRDASSVGWVRIYDQIEEQHQGEIDPQYGLDYSPLRLAVMMQWYRWTQRQPALNQPTDWRPSYEFNRPLLQFNTLCELASAVAMFLLVRLWVARRREGQPGAQTARQGDKGAGAPRQSESAGPVAPLSPDPGTPASSGYSFRPTLLGGLAALLVWFNPAIIWEAHCWPQWEVWVLPFFLFAVLCASLDWWLSAGAMIAVGALFKGQMLLAAPVFLLWPLFTLRFGAALRLVSGFVIGGGILVSPWIVRTTEARLWVGMVALAVALLCPWPFLDRKRRVWWIGAGISALLAVALAIWPFRSIGAPALVLVGLGAAVVIAGLLRLISGRQLPFIFAGAIAAALVLCVPLFDGRLSWYRVGFEYGTRHFLTLQRPDASNLPAILATRWNWNRDDIALTLPAQMLLGWPDQPMPFTLRDLLVGVYLTTLLLCGIGAAIHARRRDPRLLIALAAPWVLLFALLPQMHQRYLFWAAGITAVAVAVDWGLVLLHVLVSLLAWSFMAHTMLRSDPSFAPGMWQFLEGTHPGIAWAVLLCAAVYLYVAITPGPRRPRLLPAT